MLLQHIMSSYPNYYGESSNIGDFQNGNNYLVEGRLEGIEADGAIEHIRVDAHTNPVSLSANYRLHPLAAVPFSPPRPYHRTSILLFALDRQNSGLRGSSACRRFAWAVIALSLFTLGREGWRVFIGVVKGEFGHGFLTSAEPGANEEELHGRQILRRLGYPTAARPLLCGFGYRTARGSG
uniref:Uncharacterized protein n=1 Tax=Zea mays TaxID=4577 RepID=A0A804N3V8_MAIZE